MKYNKNRGTYVPSSYRGPSSSSDNTQQPETGATASNTSAPSSTGSSVANASSGSDTSQRTGNYYRNTGHSGRYAGVHKPSRYNNSGFYHKSSHTQGNNNAIAHANSYYHNQQYYDRRRENVYSGSANDKQVLEYSDDSSSRPASSRTQESTSTQHESQPRSRFQNITVTTHNQGHAPATNTSNIKASWKRSGHRLGSTSVSGSASPATASPHRTGSSTSYYNTAQSDTSAARSELGSTNTVTAGSKPPRSNTHSPVVSPVVTENFYAEFTRQLETAVISEQDLKKAGSVKHQIREVYKEYDNLDAQITQNRASNMLKALEVQQMQVNYESIKIMSTLNQEALDEMLLQG